MSGGGGTVEFTLDLKGQVDITKMKLLAGINIHLLALNLYHTSDSGNKCSSCRKNAKQCEP